MNVHQMSVTYVMEHDRILLRIGTTEGEEMRLWLTRRLMLGLWPALGQAVLARATLQPNTPVADEATRRLMAEFEREALLQQSDFATPYVQQEALLPLGAEPLLVAEVEVAQAGAGQLRVHFREKPEPGSPQRGFQLELAPQLAHGLVHLLSRALQHAQWGLESAPAAQPAAEPSLAEGRPKYLN